MGKERVQFVLKLLRTILCLAIVVLAVLAWLNIFAAGLSIVVILLGVTMFIYGLEYWNDSKLLASFTPLSVKKPCSKSPKGRA